MLKFIATKISRLVVTILGTTLLVILLMHAIPGNPWSNYSDAQPGLRSVTPTASSLRDLSHRFGLDMPLWRQFTRYILGDVNEDGTIFCGAICGNLGPSTQQPGRSVNNVLFAAPEGKGFWESRFGYSIRLVFLAGLIAVGFGVPLGVWMGTKPYSLTRRLTSFSLAALVSVPNFIIGLLAIIVFASWLKWIKVLPDWSDPVNWIIPSFVLASIPMANIARVTASAVNHIMGEDYVRTARGKGLGEHQILYVHVLRNAVVPIIVFLGPVIIELFSGLLIVEGLYSFPGFGREYWSSVLKLDYPVILALTIIYASGVTLVNLTIDVASKILDPRLRAIEQPGTAP
jgi:oligopeptide transport system permease protein